VFIMYVPTELDGNSLNVRNPLSSLGFARRLSSRLHGR
jgi:hypothetical protein